jgi:hypothetical protein
MNKKAFVAFFIGVFLLIQPISAQTWQSPKRLTWNSANSFSPVIATDSNDNIHVLWHDWAPGNLEIYYKKSTNGGSTWTTKRLTYNSDFSGYPAIAIDTNNHIHVVWFDETPGNTEIYYKKSTNEGATWTTKRLTYNSGSAYHPSIAVDSNNNIYIVWNDTTPGNDEIYYKESTNGGTSWTTKRLTYNSGSSEYPDIKLDSNDHIHLVWQDHTPGNPQIFYKKSTNGGSSWTTKRLTWDPRNSWFSSIAVDSNNHIHVSWTLDFSGKGEIHHKMSTNGGTTWATKRLTYNSGSSMFPANTVDSNNHVYLVWYDDTPGNNEIYYKKSTNGGTSWSTNRLTWNSSTSVSPAVATDSNNNIHVVWHDNSPGNFEIFYRKGIQ